MLWLDLALVVGIVWLVVYLTVRLLPHTDAEPQRRALPAGHWRAAHYDAEGETLVVLQKIPEGGASILDEHVIARIPLDDPDYDGSFMAAMSTARERRALFEAEEE